MILVQKDLINANNSSMANNLKTVVQELKTLKSSIVNFTLNSKNTLKGEVFDAYRSNFQKYSNLLTNFISVATSLNSGIISANNNLISFMENYTKLDDSNVLNLQNLVNQLSENIDYLRVLGNRYSSLNKKQNLIMINREISVYYDELIILEKKLRKLKELPAADNNATGILKNCVNALSSLKKT